MLAVELLVLVTPRLMAPLKGCQQPHELPGQATPTLEGFLQANFTLGAHPAHAY